MARVADIKIDMIDPDAWKSFIPGPWILSLLRTSKPRADQLQMLDRHRHQTDKLADDLVAAMRRRPNGGGRAQFERALEHGIDTVEDPMPELVAYIAALEERPYWVDDNLLRDAQRALARMPIPELTSGVAAIGLPSTYVSYRANAVLMLAGDLEKKAAPRLVETMTWMVECALPGGLERFGAGFTSTARVRLMHAQIRAGIAKLGDWDKERLGTPVNQLQQSYALMSFVGGLVFLGGLMWSFTPREIRAIFHLYRYMGYLIGVPAELQVTGLRDMFRLLVMIQDTELGMDDNGRKLTVALHKSVPALHGLPADGPLAPAIRWASRHFHADLARLVLGNRYADAAGVDKLSPMAVFVPLWAVRNHLRNDLRAIRFLGRSEQRLERDAAARRRELRDVSGRVKADTSFLRDHAGATISRNAAANAAGTLGKARASGPAPAAA